MQGVQVKLCYPLTMRAIPERLRDASCGGTIQIDYLYPLPFNKFVVDVRLQHIVRDRVMIRNRVTIRVMV